MLTESGFGEPVVLNQGNGWSAEVNDLPVAVDGEAAEYSVRELPVEGYSSEVSGVFPEFRVVNSPDVPPSTPPATPPSTPTTTSSTTTETTERTTEPTTTSEETVESSEAPSPSTTPGSGVEATEPPGADSADTLARSGAQVRELLVIGGVLAALGVLFLVTRRRKASI